MIVTLASMGMIRRAGWLTVFAGLLGWVVYLGIKKVEFEDGTRDMLLAVQSALQDYHVDQERYIPREKLSGTEVLSVLSDFDFLDELPINPWSGQKWKLDGEEPDHLVYQTDPSFETYSLKAIDPKNGNAYMELDSEENRSLE